MPQLDLTSPLRVYWKDRARTIIQRALNFVQRMEAAGGTAVDEALAKTLLGHTNKNEPNLVVFLTDRLGR